MENRKSLKQKIKERKLKEPIYRAAFQAGLPAFRDFLLKNKSTLDEDPTLEPVLAVFGGPFKNQVWDEIEIIIPPDGWNDPTWDLPYNPD